MSSEIGDKSLLRRVAESLKILDPKLFASRLKTDEVIPVVDVSAWLGAPPITPPASQQWEYLYGSGTADLSGTNSGVIPISSLIPGYDADKIHRVVEFWWKLTAVGATVSGATDARFDWNLYSADGESNFPYMEWRGWEFVDNDADVVTEIWYALGGCQATPVYPVDAKPLNALGAQWGGLVPPGKDLNMGYYCDYASLPAGSPGTILDWRAIIVQGDAALGNPPG